MRTCSTSKAVAVAAAVFSAAYGFSQTAVTMPSVSAPMLGESFYTPGMPRTAAGTAAHAEASAGEAGGQDGDGNASGSALTGVRAALTASDIQRLGSSGALDQLEAFLNGDDDLLSDVDFGHLYTSRNAGETSVMLQKLLAQLAEIKQQSGSTAAPEARPQGEQDAAPAARLVSLPHARQSVPRAHAVKPSRLIRFSVNGVDVLSTCRTVYISDVQADGTFLVTGDRRYQGDGGPCAETFHLLFKTSGAASGQGYAAAVAVAQDTRDEGSLLYQLSQRDNLQATRTGNLVSMRTSEPDWKLEMLIDLGDAAR